MGKCEYAKKRASLVDKVFKKMILTKLISHKFIQ